MNESEIIPSAEESEATSESFRLENDARFLAEKLEQYLPRVSRDVDIYETDSHITVLCTPKPGFNLNDVTRVIDQIHNFCRQVYAA